MGRYPRDLATSRVYSVSLWNVGVDGSGRKGRGGTGVTDVISRLGEGGMRGRAVYEGRRKNMWWGFVLSRHRQRGAGDSA